jgi:amino acid transporter
MPGKNFIFISLIIFSMFLPFLVGAITPGTVPGAKELGTPESPVKTPEGLIDVAAGIVKWVYIIFFIIAVMFILFAAFNYLSGAGNPEKLKKAHDMIIYAAIAIAIALLAVGAVTIIKNFLLQEGGTTQQQTQQPQQQKGLAPPWQPPKGWWPEDREGPIGI